MWIDELHEQIAYLLQRESETAKNVAAELSLSRFRALIHAFLTAEKWQGKLEAKADDLLWAMTERLPFLALTTTVDNESCVLFPLRSLQEYFAAKYLLRIEDMEERYDTLRAISLSAYWRNVFLFVAGSFSKDGIQSANDVIFSICHRNNGEKGVEPPKQTACQLTLPGSRLALDLLCDNLFERRRGQDRFLELTATLLAWDNPNASPLENFLKLPPTLLTRLIREYAIPRLRETKDPNEVAFALLWKVAQDGNVEVRDQLEELSDKLLLPSHDTMDNLLRCRVEGLGPKLLRQTLYWVTECHARYYDFDSKEARRLIDWTCTVENRKTLPKEVKRWAVYWILIDYCAFYYFSSPRELTDIDAFLLSVYKALGEKLGEGKANEIYFRTCFQAPQETPDWVSLEKLFIEQGFEELSTLAAFRLEPCAERIGNLIEATEHLPDGLRHAFLFVLREQDWLLRELSESLEAGESSATLRRRYCDEEIKRYREREASIILALKEQNYAALSAINAWKDIDIFSLDPGGQDFPVFFDRICNKTIQISRIHHQYSLSDASRTAILHRFSECFSDWGKAAFALQAFAETPVSKLASNGLTYPAGLPKFALGSLVQYYTRAIVERLEALCKLGGPYIEAYALVPYIFGHVETKELRCLAGSAASHYEAVKTGGNDCALLGVILLLLMGEIPSGLYCVLREELKRLLGAGINHSLWYHFLRHFSLKGEMLAHEAGMVAFKGTDQEKSFLRRSRCAILQNLEALPAERGKLPDPAAVSCV